MEKNYPTGKEDILKELGEIYFYNCQTCGASNLSRDEVHQANNRDEEVYHLKLGQFICLKCWYKERHNNSSEK